MAEITLQNISKKFAGRRIIDNVSLKISDGKCTVLIGPSGCGKSTLLRLICGLEQQDTGDIFLNSTLINKRPPSRRGIAMVFQSYALYPHMTVYENMSFALKIRKHPKRDIQAIVMHTAKMLHIDDLLDRYPNQLSGGQKQRVAIGRAIVRKPFAFLFDEPLSNLDVSLRTKMRYELSRIKNNLNTTFVYVTHDQIEAMSLADQLVIMKDGKIEQVGSPTDVFNHPANMFVAEFISDYHSINFIQLTLVQKLEDTGVFMIQNHKISIRHHTIRNMIIDTQYILGIRPQHLHVSHTDDGIPCTIEMIEHMGTEKILYAKCSFLKENICIKNIDNNIGDKIKVAISEEFCYFFNTQGDAC